MSTTTMDPRITNSAELQAMLDTIDDLPTIPDVLFRILKVLDDPASGACDLAEEERAAFLEQACAQDPGLRADVESLLACDGPGGRLADQAPAASAPSDAALPEGRTIGDYRILREIGRGGMGTVYEAEQASMERRVALKLIDARQLTSRQQVERFHQEAVAAARDHALAARRQEGGRLGGGLRRRRPQRPVLRAGDLPRGRGSGQRLDGRVDDQSLR